MNLLQYYGLPAYGSRSQISEYCQHLDILIFVVDLTVKTFIQSWPSEVHLVCVLRVFCSTHLDFLAVYLDQPLPEVHPDGGLCFLGELAGTEAVGEASLPDTRVSDHDDFKDAGPRRRKGRARQRAGESTRRAALRHIRTDDQPVQKLLSLLCDERICKSLRGISRTFKHSCDQHVTFTVNSHVQLNDHSPVNAPRICPQLCSHVQCCPDKSLLARHINVTFTDVWERTDPFEVRAAGWLHAFQVLMSLHWWHNINSLRTYCLYFSHFYLSCLMKYCSFFLDFFNMIFLFSIVLLWPDNFFDDE